MAIRARGRIQRMGLSNHHWPRAAPEGRRNSGGNERWPCRRREGERRHGPAACIVMRTERAKFTGQPRRLQSGGAQGPIRYGYFRSARRRHWRLFPPCQPPRQSCVASLIRPFTMSRDKGGDAPAEARHMTIFAETPPPPAARGWQPRRRDARADRHWPGLGHARHLAVGRATEVPRPTAGANLAPPVAEKWPLAARVMIHLCGAGIPWWLLARLAGLV